MSKKSFVVSLFSFHLSSSFPSPRPDEGASSPRTRGTITTTRRNTRTSSGLATVISEDHVTPDWVQNYVKNAISEATAPLLSEIERLKQRVEDLESAGSNLRHEDLTKSYF